MNVRTAMKTASLVLLVSMLGSLGWATQARSQSVPSRVFVVAPYTEIHMTTGGSTWCINLEPVNNSFQLTDVDACTIVLSSPGTGSVSQISFDCTKTATIGDSDANGIQDIRFCFTKVAMQPLFDHLHGNKPKSVTLTLSGRTTLGQTFSGSVTVLLYLNG